MGCRVEDLKRLSALGVETVRQLAYSDEAALVAEFGPRMGTWYRELGRGLGSAVVDDSPWIARGHSRETTYQQNLSSPEEVRDAIRELAEQVHADVAKEGRPVFRVTLKIRYAPFFTQTKARKLQAPTHDEDDVVAAVALADAVEPARKSGYWGAGRDGDARGGSGRPDADPRPPLIEWVPVHSIKGGRRRQSSRGRMPSHRASRSATSHRAPRCGAPSPARMLPT